MLNESESVPEVVKSQLKGRLIHSSQPNSRHSGGEDKTRSDVSEVLPGFFEGILLW